MSSKSEVQKPGMWGAFSLYDVLGYLIPGGTLVAAVVGLAHHHQLLSLLFGNPRNPSLAGSGSVEMVKALPWPLWAAGGLLLSYIVGHTVAAISSLVLEKIFVRSMLRYPTSNMIPAPSNESTSEVEAAVMRNRRKWGDTLKSILLGYRGTMGGHTAPAFRAAFAARFGHEVLEHDLFNVFPLCFAAIKEKRPVTYERVMHYVNAYGFARNTAMALFLAAAATPFIPSLTHGSRACAMVVLAATGACFVRQYLKFFRRVNDEVFFQFVVDNWRAASTSQTAAAKGAKMDNRSVDSALMSRAASKVARRKLFIVHFSAMVPIDCAWLLWQTRDPYHVAWFMLPVFLSFGLLVLHAVYAFELWYFLDETWESRETEKEFAKLKALHNKTNSEPGAAPSPLAE